MALRLRCDYGGAEAAVSSVQGRRFYPAEWLVALLADRKELEVCTLAWASNYVEAARKLKQEVPRWIGVGDRDAPQFVTDALGRLHRVRDREEAAAALAPTAMRKPPQP